MGIYLIKLKTLIVSIGLLAGSILGHGAENATAALTLAANTITSRAIHIEVSVSSATTADSKKPMRIILTKSLEENVIVTPTSTPVKAPEKKPSRNPFQRPPKTESAPAASPKLQSTPKPSPKPTTLPALSPTPQPSAQPNNTPAPIKSPDVSMGTLLISNNPPYVKMGSMVAFSVYVRDSTEAVVKNKTLEFIVNNKTIFATTDENGNVFLETPTPTGFVGKLEVRVELNGKQATFVVEVVDTKPSLSLSSFAFTVTGFHVRLRNAAGESVPNWQVTEIRRDGTVMATKLTNELGVIEFDLPSREAGGHLYACAEVKDIGRQCEEW